jgi:hypothetical protein
MRNKMNKKSERKREMNESRKESYTRRNKKAMTKERKWDMFCCMPD